MRPGSCSRIAKSLALTLCTRRNEDRVKSLFLGVYWASRKESRTDCAARLARFLSAGTGVDPTLERWFLKANRKKDAIIAADITTEGVDALLKTNKKDTTGEPITELGFSLGIWNGESASLSATVGAFSPYVGNSVVLSYNGDSPASAAVWRTLIERAVEAFDPDTAVVTNHDYVASHGDGAHDEAGGWFRYRRGTPIVECEFP